MKINPSQSKCLDLSPEHLAILESWLFEENLTLDDALAKARTELGFTGSRSSLYRFHQARMRERALREMVESAAQLDELEVPPGTEGKLFSVGMKLLAQQFLSRVIADGTTDLPTLAGLLMQSETNVLRREEMELKKQALELRRQRMELDREAWELEKIEQSVKVVAKLDALKPTDADYEVSYYDHRFANLRNRLLYGPLRPEDMLPETEEQEQAAEAERARRQAAFLREQAELKENSKEAQLPDANSQTPATVPAPAPAPDDATPPPAVPPNPLDAITDPAIKRLISRVISPDFGLQ